MSNYLSKKERRELIQKLVSEGDFATEQELTDTINEKYGDGESITSKTTIHRDFKDLKIKKIGGYYRPTKQTKQLRFKKRLEDSKKNIRKRIIESEFDLEILKVEEGYAEMIAHEMEQAKPEVLATFVSGNKILVATKKNIINSY
ncbi:hypothetical protein [Halanaerobium salsuginis]|uniref:Arginine repressor n=1 Tax=Halanaerobium salsuginis TaxID=29563 RepID=A0A1I4FZP8_9FIRM|nr:hypothetical protein [Halanaerobium salsuginis]SFL22770.1 Arginine repressor [Halanaerobium salsuginis]